MQNNFLLSSSMDKTVRLWHISRPECLCTFKHTDFVPAIQFHPRDDRFFIAGSLDQKLRLWSIPDKSVAYVADVPDSVTAVCFTPDGKQCVAGTIKGLCLLYETDGLKYQTQTQVRSAHGRNAKDSKITGIQAMESPSEDPQGDVKLLISSNDSRVRLYNLKDRSLDLKFKGHENNFSQIRASFSDDGRFVICGSEDHKTLIWSMSVSQTGEKRDQRPVEMFEANTSITTSAILAPTKTKQLLSKGEDPIFDLCNPPPVTLVSKAEESERVGTDNGSGAGTTPTPTPATNGRFKRVEESPTYLSRAAHPGGHIIVTADYSGAIKVFRQDCAFVNRLKAENWDTASTFSKKMGSGILRRRGSIATTASGDTKRNSGLLRHESNSTQPASDRIMSWRQGVHGAASTGSLDKRSSRAWSARSNSPRKSMTMSLASRPPSTSQLRAETPPLPATSASGSAERNGTTTPSQTANSSPAKKPLPSQTEGRKTDPPDKEDRRFSNPLQLVGNQSNMFWDKSAWKRQVDSSRLAPQEERPDMLTKTSTFSALTSEQLSSGQSSSLYDSAEDR